MSVIDKTKRLVAGKEAEDAGYAAETMREASLRLLAGDLYSVFLNAEQIAQACETLEKYSEEEQLELFLRALKEGEKNG